MSDVALCVSLCTSVTVKEQLACRKQFINVMSNDKYLDKLRTSKHFGHFLENIFGKRWTSDWTRFEKCPNLTPLVPINQPNDVPLFRACKSHFWAKKNENFQNGENMKGNGVKKRSWGHQVTKCPEGFTVIFVRSVNLCAFQRYTIVSWFNERLLR